MTTARDTIVQHLQEAHALELALLRTLRAHRATAPSGAYRSALDDHLLETRGHAEALARRLRELGRAPRRVAPARRLAERLGALGGMGLARVHGSSADERALRNAKDECASEALEIATYDALEALARRAGDEATAALAAAHRDDDERMLETLSGLLPSLAAAVVGGEDHDPPRSADGSAGTVASPLPGYDELTADHNIVARRLGDPAPAREHAAG